MRVVVDGGSWSNRRGFGRFTRELVGALAAHGRHAYTVVVDRSVEPRSMPANLRVVTADLGTPASTAASADGYRSPLDLLRMSRALAAQPGDLLFFPCVYTFVPVLSRRPVVTGIHDTIPERYPELVFPNARGRLFWTLKVAAAVRQSARIVTVSEYASRCIQTHFGLPSSRVRTITEAPASVFRPVSDAEAIAHAYRSLGLDASGRFVLYVGGLAPHKNLARVIRAFGAVVRDAAYADATLVLVGEQASDVFHTAVPELRTLAASLPEGRVVFAGAIPDDQLVLLLNGARALMLASLDEGFGLPAIEAAACGTPVIATTASAVPEVLGDAALYVDPLDEASIADALRRVLADATLRTSLGAVGAERARALTWQSAAHTLESIFDEFAVGGGHA